MPLGSVGQSVILIYRHRSGDAEWKDEHYAVCIVRTPCNLGGWRAWFICPAVGCDQLGYASSREDVGDRANQAG
jgi:hypothetical protein